MPQLRRKLVRVVEFDVDFCTNTYGVGPCTASLSMPGAPRKCYNTFPSCQDKPNFNAGTLTLRFCEPRVDLPSGPITFPVLDSVSPTSATVNIAGTNEQYNGLGRRGTISAKFTDFPYNDRVTDKYAVERVSGAAQLDEPGYNPEDRGTFFGKLKARWPTYGDRPFRYIEGYLDEDTGEFVVESTRHYVITDFKGPDRDGEVTVEGKDILSLADDKKALCPRPSRGQMRFEMFDRLNSEGAPNPSYNPDVELTPEGIGDAEYPASGFATLGREIVSFTRVGDIVTLTGRGLFNTQERSHREGTTFQLAKRVVGTRIDDLVEDLLVNFGNVPSEFIPKAKWKSDVTRWASTLVLDAIITQPEGVQKLVAELAVLGVSVWWDDTDQEVGLKINSPVFGEDIVDWDEDSHIIDVEQEDHDEDRLTQVHFYSVQTDPTASPTDKGNYDRVIVAIDAEAEQQNSYRNPRVREIFCRWVNNGADSILLINALRLLARFNTAPIKYTVTIDNKDNGIKLVDVVRLNTRVAQDLTGKPKSRLSQVNKKTSHRQAGWTNIQLQEFFFEGQFRLVAPNNTPVYGTATQAQKDQFGYMISAGEDFFPDGAPAHQLI